MYVPMYVKKAAETTYERKTHVCLTLMKLTPGLSKKRNGFLWNEDFLANSSFHFDRYPLRPKCRQKLEQKMHFQISKRKKKVFNNSIKTSFWFESKQFCPCWSFFLHWTYSDTNFMFKETSCVKVTNYLSEIIYNYYSYNMLSLYFRPKNLKSNKSGPPGCWANYEKTLLRFHFQQPSQNWYRLQKARLFHKSETLYRQLYNALAFWSCCHNMKMLLTSGVSGGLCLVHHGEEASHVCSIKSRSKRQNEKNRLSQTGW